MKKPVKDPQRHTGRDEVEIRYPVKFFFSRFRISAAGGFRNDGLGAYTQTFSLSSSC